MAKPITKTTPLKGRDADAFIKAAEENEKRQLSKSEMDEIKASLDRAFDRFRGMKIVLK
jgi:hypothetical protein